MASKTSLGRSVKGFRFQEVAAALEECPELRGYRDPRGRNWLHLCCATDVNVSGRKASDSIRTADVLLEAGFAIDAPAFREGSWKATPLWFAVGRGRNPALVKALLDRGADPEHCLWAAAFVRDLASIRRLVAAGADLEAVAEGDTPFLWAVRCSRFDAAGLLLKLGANPDFQAKDGTTALHAMLEKSSDLKHFEMLARHGARGDLPDARGRTAIEILRRKRSPGFRKLAERLAG